MLSCSRPEAAAVLQPDSSFSSLVLLDGSGVAGSYGHVREGDAGSHFEQLRDDPENAVYNEQAMHSSDGLAPSNVEYAGEQILQPVRKTAPIADIVAKYHAPQQHEPQDPSIVFYEPPHVPENFPRDPVPQGGKGEGWPYAPQGWPKPDDKWGWRVGQRAAANSLWIDRYVTVPVSLMKGIKPSSEEQFASKSRLVEYLRQAFPQMKDPNSIFKAFDWKVPAPKNFEAPEKRGPNVKRDKTLLVDGDDWQKFKRQCRAGNLHCPLTKAKYSGSELLERLVCNICCSEPNFCRECKCALCCKSLTPDADDFSIIRCLNSPLSDPGSPSSGPICGHAAHLECALNSRLAGVIKKNGFYLEYMCRRCDRKTDLKEIVSRLVSECMSKTVTESVESSLQLMLRLVQDPDDGESSKIQEILIGALKKVQEGADIVESCKELTEQLLTHLELQSGRYIDDNQMLHQVPNWSRARGRKRTCEDSLQSYETSVEKRVSRFKSVGSPDAQGTEKNNKSTPAMNVQQACPDGTSLAVNRVNSTIACKEFCGENGVTATSGTRSQTNLKMDEQLSSASLQSSLEPEDIVPSISIDILSCAPLLSTLLHQSVCKPPTLLLEDHIRECEAMTARVKCAGQLNSSPSVFPVCIPGSAPSLTASSLTVKHHGNQERVNAAVEGPDDGRSPSAAKLVTSVPSSPRAKSPSLFDSQGADDHVANAGIMEVQKSSRMRPVTRSSSRRAKDAILFDLLDADDQAPNTRIIEVDKASRVRPVTRSSSRRAKSPSLFNSQDADDHTATRALLEADKSSRVRPITRSSSRRAKSPLVFSSQDEGGHPTASINMSEPFMEKPPTSSSKGIGLSLANSRNAGGDDVVVAQAIEVLPETEPPHIIENNPALETTDTAGFGAEFENQIIEALEELKRAQAVEYARAEESLHAQKNIIIEQYHQLAKNGRNQQGRRKKSRAKFDRAVNRLMARYGNVQKEQKVFESMLAISNGFGQVSKEFLRQFFNWSSSDITEA